MDWNDSSINRNTSPNRWDIRIVLPFDLRLTTFIVAIVGFDSSFINGVRLPICGISEYPPSEKTKRPNIRP